VGFIRGGKLGNATPAVDHCRSCSEKRASSALVGHSRIARASREWVEHCQRHHEPTEAPDRSLTRCTPSPGAHDLGVLALAWRAAGAGDGVQKCAFPVEQQRSPILGNSRGLCLGSGRGYHK